MEQAKQKKNSSWNTEKTMTVVGLGLLTAIVVVLQAFAVSVSFSPTTNVTFVLIPIIVGTALFGWKAGAWLGAVFGAVVLITGQAAGFMTLNPFGTIVTVMLKGILAGVVAGIVYSLIAKRNTPKSEFAAVLTAGIVAPVVNTGIYILGCFVFFFNTMIAAGATEKGMNAFAYVIFIMVGGNFLLELGINLVLASAVVYIIKLAKKMIKTH